jgi:hypothetical protein
VKFRSAYSLASALLLLGVAGCGDNIATTPNEPAFGPPRNVAAYSVNDSTVYIMWSAALGSSDSMFLGYIIQFGTTSDTVAKTVLSYTADSLPRGEIQFILYSLKMNGQRSSAAQFRWAGATRFDSTYVVTEHNVSVPTRNSGLDVGTQSLSPSLLPVDIAAQSRLDLLLYGGNGQAAAPLALWSPLLYQSNWNPTKFSTISHAAPSLDYPLPAFPGPSTFTRDSVVVSDNTIYYLQVAGDNNTTLYGRIHIHIRPGASFPDRVVEVRISLQRLPGVVFARNAHEQECSRALTQFRLRYSTS